MTALAEPVTGRSYTCGGCGHLRTTSTLTGPYPRICEVCDPDAEAARQHNRRRNISVWRARSARIAELERQVAGLQALLKFEAEGGERANSCGDPGRDSLARAVGRLARRQDTTGVAETIEALLTISAIARAWAARLAAPPPARAGVGPRL